MSASRRSPVSRSVIKYTMRTIFVFLKIFQPTYNKAKDRQVDILKRKAERGHYSMSYRMHMLEVAFHLYAAMKSGH